MVARETYDYVIKCADGEVYTWARTEEEAREERASANGLRELGDKCECGGEHEWVGPSEPRVTGPRGMTGDRKCGRCGQVGHNVRTCVEPPRSSVRV